MLDLDWDVCYGERANEPGCEYYFAWTLEEIPCDGGDQVVEVEDEVAVVNDEVAEVIYEVAEVVDEQALADTEEEQLSIF